VGINGGLLLVGGEIGSVKEIERKSGLAFTKGKGKMGDGFEQSRKGKGRWANSHLEKKQRCKGKKGI
jgi:hypothetical protein